MTSYQEDGKAMRMRSSRPRIETFHNGQFTFREYMSEDHEKEGELAEQSGRIVFCLYVAGEAPNSLQARNNLLAFCQSYLPDRVQIEIVDVLKDPHRALNDGILVTPTLVKLSPTPSWKMIGNLSESRKLLDALGLFEE